MKPLPPDSFGDPSLQPAVAAHQSGRLDAAEAAYRGKLSEQPANAPAWHYLAILLWQTDRRDEALHAAAEAVALAPTAVKPRHNLGAFLLESGDAAAASGHFAALAQLAPELPQGPYGLGLTAAAQGRYAEAAEHFRAAIALDPEAAEAHYNLACAFKGCDRTAEAEAPLRHALALRPEYPEALGNLANVLAGSRPTEAEPLARRALELQPENAKPAYTLGLILENQNRHPEAEACYRRAVALDPQDAETWSTLLAFLNYCDDKPAEDVVAAHRDWGRRQGGQPAVAHANARDPGRRLRVGYVSPDFRTHSVGYFIEPVLAAHDAAAVEVFAYSARASRDGATDRLRGLAQHWRDIFDTDDDRAATMIRADRIDILVDLAGHTSHNRLALFARRPAPVQMTWIGYPNTTGLAAMDWRLVDAVTDPSGAERLAVERLLRLPGCFLCYRPPAAAPEPGRSEGRPFTFGSFNKLQKASPATLAAWAAILRRVPGARLLLKSRQLADPGLRRQVVAAFAAHGVAAERLDLRGQAPALTDHLGLYDEVDVALDPFPYNGTTTTCEALWMGVPVVTWAGDRHAARVGASLLAAVDLPELVAADVEGYVNIAAGLANDPGRLAALRRELRPRMAASSLCDAKGFCRGLEAAYRAAWRQWCEDTP